MANFFENVIKSMEIERYICNVQGRKIIIWGAGGEGEKLSNILIEKGHEIYSFVDKKAEGQEYKFNGKDVLKPELLIGNSRDFFVFVAGDYKDEIELFLTENNYEEVEDYLYIIHKSTSVLNDGEYTDIYANNINAPKGTKFKFLGYNSTINIKTELSSKVEISCTGSSINIGSNCNIGEQITITCIDDSSIDIGEGCLIGDKVTITCTEGSHLNLTSPCKIREKSIVGCIERSSIDIGQKCSFSENSSFFAKKDSSISIGKGSHGGADFVCVSSYDGKIKIGDDCMISTYVVVMANDGHPIFDVKTGKHINGGQDITIGEHVWFGIKCTVLSNSEIGDGSIIGANSVVTKKFTNNCVVAGNPARLVRKDVAWDREEANSDLVDKSLYWNETH